MNPQRSNGHTPATATPVAADVVDAMPRSGLEYVDNEASIQQQLATALFRIEALEKVNSLLKDKAALLAELLAQSRRLAYRDPLTDLPNRRLLNDHFGLAVAQARRRNNAVVVLFLDLDDYKHINDTIGHAAADRLLQQVAHRLTACVRASDTLCRYGGDEFLILLPDIDDIGQAHAVIENVHARLATPCLVGGEPLRATASIGWASWPADGESLEELIKVADAAMFREKARRKGARGRVDNGNGRCANAQTGSGTWGSLTAAR